LAGIDALADFIKECGLPTTLRELGVDESLDLREVADSCYTSGGAYREIQNDEIYEIFKECY
ncbi:MAG: iron-containing alcohol dehydrogenase, partial [Eubacteriales bacterium]|nr:iron-containing alcohol dehydrogenase [Eubacteriales bacterium]